MTKTEKMNNYTLLRNESFIIKSKIHVPQTDRENLITNDNTSTLNQDYNNNSFNIYRNKNNYNNKNNLSIKNTNHKNYSKQNSCNFINFNYNNNSNNSFSQLNNNEKEVNHQNLSI